MLVFIDESGDSGIKGKAGSSEFFVMVAVIFEDNDEAEDCDRRIEGLKKECFSSPLAEFHFSKCNHDRRCKFFQTAAGCDFFYMAFVLNKAKLWGPGFAFKETFYKYTAKLLFENAKPYLSNATLVLDRTGNRDFRQQLEKYLKKKINGETGEQTKIKKLKTEPSHSNNLIQLADMICGAVGRSFKNDKEAAQYRTMISARELSIQVWPKV
jgi:hypothetical protein